MFYGVHWYPEDDLQCVVHCDRTKNEKGHSREDPNPLLTYLYKGTFFLVGINRMNGLWQFIEMTSMSCAQNKLESF